MAEHSAKLRSLGVLGGGESGLGAAYLGYKKGLDVFLSDSASLGFTAREELKGLGISFEEGRHTLERLLACDIVVKSPGIPQEAPIVLALREQGTPIISEIEFAAYFTDAKMVCVTGSNGKTTTASLLYHMMKSAGLNVALGGNVGRSFAREVADGDYDYFVLELSSFQLEDMYDFRADIAILLNITPDHLDRYGHEMQRYVDAKMRITQNLTSDSCFIFCSDDAVTLGELKHIVLTAKELPFTQSEAIPQQGAWREADTMHFRLADHEEWCLAIEKLPLQGRHNVYNMMAVGLAGEFLNIRNEVIRRSLQSFVGIPHRLEFIREIGGVRYINDSKATNVNAAWYALESMTRPVVWIAGGTDKGNDYSFLHDLVKERVHTLICLGKENEKLKEAFGGLVTHFEETQSAKDAVELARRFARIGDAVLLSPACASFDLFKNYEDRGDQFKAAVLAL